MLHVTLIDGRNEVRRCSDDCDIEIQLTFYYDAIKQYICRIYCMH